MSTMVRFEPFRDLNRLSDEVNRLLGRADGAGNGVGDGAPAWTPAIDVIESADAIELKADLPGLSGEDVSVEVHDGVLTLRGERTFTDRVEAGRYHRLERSYGHFSRSLTLPKGVKADEITATFDAGVLSVRVPKADEVTPRRIPVSGGATA